MALRIKRCSLLVSQDVWGQALPGSSPKARKRYTATMHVRSMDKAGEITLKGKKQSRPIFGAGCSVSCARACSCCSSGVWSWSIMIRGLQSFENWVHQQSGITITCIESVGLNAQQQPKQNLWMALGLGCIFPKPEEEAEELNLC